MIIKLKVFKILVKGVIEYEQLVVVLAEEGVVQAPTAITTTTATATALLRPGLVDLHHFRV